MTTKTDGANEKPNDETSRAQLDRLNANMAKMDELTKRLVASFNQRKKADPGLQAPGQDVYVKAMAGYFCRSDE